MSKEHPILFTGEMVRRILAGHKTVTRRVMKVQPSRQDDATLATLMCTTDSAMRKHIGKSHWTGVAANGYEFGWEDVKYFRCPYGFAGDRLWVRENFSPNHSLHVSHGGILYQATAETDRSWHGAWASKKDKKWSDFYNRPLKWKPNIHMPRGYCRLELKVTSVKVERVQEIDELGALDEGVECDPRKTVHGTMVTSAGTKTGDWIGGEARDGFQLLWDSINAARGYSWESNPWVWVVEFERVA